MRSRDLTGTDLVFARTPVRAGTHRARTQDTVGARTQIQVHACDKGIRVGVLQSKIHMLVQYNR